jgi:hypothetical protein
VNDLSLAVPLKGLRVSRETGRVLQEPKG